MSKNKAKGEPVICLKLQTLCMTESRARARHLHAQLLPLGHAVYHLFSMILEEKYFKQLIPGPVTREPKMLLQ